MSSALPLLIGAGAAGYLLLRKKKTAVPNVVIKASPPSAYQMPPAASPTDLAPPPSEIVDIQGFGASGDQGSVTFASISDIFEALDYASNSAKVAATKCPKSASAYKGVVADIDDIIEKYSPNYPPASTVATAKQGIESANVLCRAEAKAAGVVLPTALVLDTPHSSGSMLPLFAVAGIAAYLLFS